MFLYNFKKTNSFVKISYIGLLAFFVFFNFVSAEKISLASSSEGVQVQALRKFMKQWGKKTGHKTQVVTMPASVSDTFAQYKIWLGAKNSDIDIYLTDVIWAAQIDNHFIDLSKIFKKEMKDHFPSVIASQTVDGGKLVGMPFYSDMGLLYYRKDLLKKYKEKVPITWKELYRIAKKIQDAERAAGNKKMQGFVFQGNPYEGLTCDALEWIRSYGSAPILDKKGNIAINNKDAIKAVDFIASFVGTISPRGVLAYMEDESRGIWQVGNSVFMRNWPYAYVLGNSKGSVVRGKFDVALLPKGEGKNAVQTGTIGGWNLSVSKYSKKQKLAIDLVRYLSSRKVQKANAIEFTKLPTYPELFSDKDIIRAIPFIAMMQKGLKNAVPRPSQIARGKYNEVSKDFWTSVHHVLAGKKSAKKAFSYLERRLKRVKGRGGW